MTPSEFAKTIRAKHPGVYDDMDDVKLTNAIIAKYPQYKDMVDSSTNPESGDFERGPNYPASSYTTDAPSMDIAMAVDAAPKLAMALPGAIKAIPKVAGAAVDGAGAVVDAVKAGAGKVGEMVGNGVDALKAHVTGTTPRAFGYAQKALATPEARDLAKDSIEFAKNAQPEVGKLVEDAARNPIAGSPGDVTALPTGEKGLATGADVAGFPQPKAVPLDGPAPDVSSFNNPIKTGMFGGDPEAMLQTVNSQKQTVGKAIENTLAKYDNAESFYNPSKVNDMVKSMLERDVNGQVMTTGPQGQINDAMKKALSGLTDYAQGKPIKWSDAARIKTMLQGDASYGQQGLSHAQQAYDQIATMLKNDIDEQAGKMLAEKGVPADVTQYQKLRDAYGKLSSLGDSLNVAAKRKAANSAIPWWVKMGAGAALGATGAGVLKGLL